MKIIVTGSLGNISKPLTEKLVNAGHQVTVVSSKEDKKDAIAALGAKPAIGSMGDVDFLATTFTGADAVYCMETLAPGAFFNHEIDIIDEIVKIGRNYKEAIAASGVKKVVHLSSIGGHTDKGNGMLAFHHMVEQILGGLPADVSIKFMRPVGFYYNMLAWIPTIKSTGMIFSNYGGDEKEPWVSPLDIAGVIAEEFDKSFEGRSFRYIASDEVTANEVAQTLGEAIGKPGLKWQMISDEQMLDGMLKAGFNPESARGFMEMNAARRGGTLYEDYNKHRPQLGSVKLRDYAKEFAAIYNQQ